MNTFPLRVFFASEIEEDGFELATVSDEDLEAKEFEILRTGEFYDRRYGKFSITDKLLNELVVNFSTNAYGQDIAVDINHESEKGAVAWIKSLSTRNGKLFAKLKDFTSEGKKLLKEKIYKYFSVEFAPFETVKDGKKLTIPNVVKGLAITNRPVIKELSATFLSEEDLIINKSDMNTFKAYAAKLLSEEKVSPRDLSILKELHATLSEEEQVETKPEVEKVEEMADATAKTEAEALAEAEAKAKADAEAAAAGDEAKLAELKLAEENKTLNVELAAMKEQNKKLALAEETREVADIVSSLTLSEKNLTGFTSTEENKKALSEFVKGLDKEQRVQFSEIVGKITVLDESQLSEIGHGVKIEESDLDKQFSEAKVEAEKMAVEKNMPLHIALAEVYKKNGLVPNE